MSLWNPVLPSYPFSAADRRLFGPLKSSFACPFLHRKVLLKVKFSCSRCSRFSRSCFSRSCLPFLAFPDLAFFGSWRFGLNARAFDAVAFAAEQLQVGDVARAAFGAGDDVIDFEFVG